MGERIVTEVSELRKYTNTPADHLCLMVVTEASCHIGEEGDSAYLHPWVDGTTFQAEGFVLQPRKLRAIPFEIVTEDKEEAIWIVEQAQQSQAPLAYQQSEANGLALEARLAR